MNITVKISVTSDSKAARTIEAIGGVVDHHYNTVNYGFCTEYSVEAEVVRVIDPRDELLSALCEYSTPTGVRFVAGHHSASELDTFRIVSVPGAQS